MGTPIPQPPELPLLGNAKDIDPQNILVSQMRLADLYGMVHAFPSMLTQPNKKHRANIQA